MATQGKMALRVWCRDNSFGIDDTILRSGFALLLNPASTCGDCAHVSEAETWRPCSETRQYMRGSFVVTHLNQVHREDGCMEEWKYERMNA